MAIKKTRLLYCRYGGLNLTEKEYSDYYGNLKQLSDKKRTELRMQLSNKQGSLKLANAKLKELSLSVLKTGTNKTVRQYGEQEIESISIQKEELEKDIEELKEKLEKSEVEEISLEQFLNLSKNAPMVVKKNPSCKRRNLQINIFEH